MEKDNLRSEYDLSRLGKPVRGKYAKAYKSGSSIALLGDDAVEALPDELDCAAEH